MGKVRCEHWVTCNASGDPHASNWCDHYEPHTPGVVVIDCGDRCFGYPGHNNKGIEARCVPVKEVTGEN